MYFLYTYKPTPYDQKMKSYERSSINQEVKLLREKGLTVEIVEDATLKDVFAAFSDPEAMMIVTSGHGSNDGTIQTADDKWIGPSDFKDVSSSLVQVIFENCHQGDFIDEWKSVLGENVDVVGWKSTTSKYETKRFNNSGFLDRQAKKLGDYIQSIINKFKQSSDLPQG